MVIVANAMNMMVIIFILTVLDSNRPTEVVMVDVEDMVGVVMSMVE